MSGRTRRRVEGTTPSERKASISRRLSFRLSWEISLDLKTGEEGGPHLIPRTTRTGCRSIALFDNPVLSDDCQHEHHLRGDGRGRLRSTIWPDHRGAPVARVVSTALYVQALRYGQKSGAHFCEKAEENGHALHEKDLRFDHTRAAPGTGRQRESTTEIHRFSTVPSGLRRLSPTGTSCLSAVLWR